MATHLLYPPRKDPSCMLISDRTYWNSTETRRHQGLPVIRCALNTFSPHSFARVVYGSRIGKYPGLTLG